MKRGILATSFIVAAIGLGPGCATHDTGAYLPENSSLNNVEDSSKFVLLNKPAQFSVTCGSLQEGRLADGRLQVHANLRNRESRRIQVQVNCVFKDAQGFVVEDTPFQNLFLDEN